MKNTNRRVFILHVAAGSSVLAASHAMAQAAAPMVDEKDAQAAALGYVADRTKVMASRAPPARTNGAAAAFNVSTNVG